MKELRLYLISFVLLSLVVVLRARISFSQTIVAGDRIRIKARLTEEPYHTGSVQIFALKGIKIVADSFPAYSYGEVLVVEGVVKEEVSKSKGRLLGSKSRQFVLVYPEISALDEVAVSGFPREGIWTRFNIVVNLVRQDLVQTFGNYLPQPHASLISGIVLGIKAKMPKKFYTALSQTGTMHTIAASGMNITIIAGLLTDALVKLIERKKALIAAMDVVFLYVLLAGASPSVVRAGIMAGLAYWAMVIGREYSGLWVLYLTAMGMLIWNPGYLDDVGWQLSVAATGGILVGVPLVEGVIDSRIKVPKLLRRELVLTLSAQIATMPIIMYHFGAVSWLSPIANLLVVPVVPVIMGWGMVLGVVRSKFVAWGAWVFLEYFVRVVEWLGG